MIKRTEHGAHIGGQHLTLTKGNRLVGQTHGIAHGAVGRAPEQPKCVIFEWNVFRCQNMGKVINHPLWRHILQ